PWKWPVLGARVLLHRHSPCSPVQQFTLAARNNRLLLRLGRSGRDPVEHDLGIRNSLWPGTWDKVKPNVLQGITGSSLQTDGCRGFVTALNHAILASRIPRDTIDDTVLAPIDLLLQLLESPIMPVRHEITGSFPAFDIPSWYRPG